MKHLNNLLRAPEEELGFGGLDGVPPASATQEAPTTPAEPAAPAAPAVPAAPTTPAPVALTQEQLKELMGSMKPQAPAPAPQAQPVLSEAEQDKLLRRFRVSPDFVKNVFAVEATPEQRAQALQELVDKTAEHAFHVAQLATQKHLKELDERYQKEFTPVREHFSRQQQEEAVKTFFTKHAYLEPYKQVVQMVAGSLDKDVIGKMKNEEVENLIVQNTVHNLKSLGINIDPRNPAQPSNPAVPRSPALSGGGRSQAITTPAGASPKTADEAAWLDATT